MKITTHLNHQTILANQARPVFFAVRISADTLAAPSPHPINKLSVNGCVGTYRQRPTP